jgi:plasmid replication initiation protein
MQFLALESARLAIKDLVEFEPTQAEDMITVLLSELPAYGFLREQFQGDLRQRRLQARDQDYRREVPALYRLAMAGTGSQWDAAKDLAAEMMKRFDLVLVDTPTERVRRATLKVTIPTSATVGA